MFFLLALIFLLSVSSLHPDAGAMQPNRSRMRRHVVLGSNKPSPPPRLPSARQQLPRPHSAPPIATVEAENMPAASPSPDRSPSPAGSPAPDDGDPNWQDEEENEEDGAPQMRGLGNSSHRSRNASRPVIPVRKHRAAAPGKNVRASATKRREARGKRTRGLNEDLKIWAAERHERAKELSVKHGMKVKEVLRRMINPSTFKPRRAPSLYNAKISRIMAQLNADLPLGERFKMPQIKAMVKRDPDMLTKFSEEEEEEMMQEARDKAETKYRGTRANNKAAQADAKATLLRLTQEIMALAERCGMIGFAMFTRGHLHDLTIPLSIQSWGALDFFREVYKKDPADVASAFELWAVGRDREEVNPDGLIPMQKECTSTMHEGLVRELKVTKVAMNFANYIKAMVYGKGVGLVGWPKGVPFKRMSLQSSIGPLRKLRDALRAGTCRWKARLSDDEKEELAAKFNRWVSKGLAEAPVEKDTEKTTRKKKTTTASKSSSTSKSKSSSTSKSASKSSSKGRDGSKSKKDDARGKKSARKARKAVEEEEGWVDVWEDPPMDNEDSGESDDEAPQKPREEMTREEKRARLVNLVERQRKEAEKGKSGDREKRKRAQDDDSGGARKKPKATTRSDKATARPSEAASKVPKRKRRVIEDDDEESTPPPPKKTKRAPAQQKTRKPGVQPTRKPANPGVQPPRPKPKPSWKGAQGAACSQASGSASAAAAASTPVSPRPSPSRTSTPASPPRSPAHASPPASPPRSPAHASPPASPPRASPLTSPPRDSVVPDSETQDSRAATAAPTMPPPPPPRFAGPARPQLGDGEIVPDSESSRATTAVPLPPRRPNCVKGVRGKKGPPGLRL
ncbi:hypothetical protein C8R43DRAFT_961794 [Mycena crocata]|nr:hypothetical protein C8R43DRAFT_961794 [Mycena crocata]